MLDQVAEPRTRYGGSWTIEKLEILERYLDAYTRALKNKSFNLMYIDAFAGTGYLEMRQRGFGRYGLHARFRGKSSACT